MIYIIFLLAHDVVKRMEYLKENIQKASDAVCKTMLKDFKGTGGLVGIDNEGNTSISFSSQRMAWSKLENVSADCNLIFYFAFLPSKKATGKATEYIMESSVMIILKKILLKKVMALKMKRSEINKISFFSYPD